MWIIRNFFIVFLCILNIILISMLIFAFFDPFWIRIETENYFIQTDSFALIAFFEILAFLKLLIYAWGRSISIFSSIVNFITHYLKFFFAKKNKKNVN
ncbi:hypothetical protein Deia_00596 [Candidatus Deianiraea vastatrix]|uniref:Uncharacterized protein n=1 Tax=Candidatus Deianiraea vastatrix TaxID=2163644 RepID=A0A5B8XDS9_9RICK|nr:hypothetical protein Deia_00596 [Candidatus Deianiraea vastatrix]